MASVSRIAVAFAAAGLAASASAAESPFDRSISGRVGNLAWEARNLIVGQTSTAVAPLGDPIYMPTRPQKNGVALLEIFFPGFGWGYCSGSVLPDGKTILTAAHCVSFGAGTPDASFANVYFYKGSGDPYYDLDYNPMNPNFALRTSTTFHVAPAYTGDVIDQNDVALVTLDSDAPDWATRYQLAAIKDLTGVDYNVAGLGDRGSSGATGATFFFGRLREGDNRFDARLGDPDFGDEWAFIFGVPYSQLEYSWVSDFDRSGFAANDAWCKVATLYFGFAPSGKYCNTGVGAREVGVAPGDSGGPQFVNGRIVSVTSYGFTGGTFYGDVDDFLNSTWGEFNGFAPLWLQRRWIESISPGAFVPEPGTWAMLIAGFGLVGGAMRRRRHALA